MVKYGIVDRNAKERGAEMAMMYKTTLKAEALLLEKGFRKTREGRSNTYEHPSFKQKIYLGTRKIRIGQNLAQSLPYSYERLRSRLERGDV